MGKRETDKQREREGEREREREREKEAVMYSVLAKNAQTYRHYPQLQTIVH